MWDYDGLMGKACVYFERAEAVAVADDDAFAIWLLLGLEFLLRAPLAKVHPALLADPNGDSILHAAGFPGSPGGKEPKSIQATTVISRLGRIVEGFTVERENEATILTALRNRELHTSEAALASIDVSVWLPGFTRVAEVICGHLGLDATDVVGTQTSSSAKLRCMIVMRQPSRPARTGRNTLLTVRPAVLMSQWNSSRSEQLMSASKTMKLCET